MKRIKLMQLLDKILNKSMPIKLYYNGTSKLFERENIYSVISDNLLHREVLDFFIDTDNIIVIFLVNENTGCFYVKE